MAKITVTLTAIYDDGKSIKEPGDQISIDDKLAQQLAALGMVVLPVRENRESRENKQAKGKKAAGEGGTESGSGTLPDPDSLDPDDPDANRDEQE